jgi:hypothetical protein
VLLATAFAIAFWAAFSIPGLSLYLKAFFEKQHRKNMKVVPLVFHPFRFVSQIISITSCPG